MKPDVCVVPLVKLIYRPAGASSIPTSRCTPLPFMVQYYVTRLASPPLSHCIPCLPLLLLLLRSEFMAPEIYDESYDEKVDVYR